MRHIKAYLRARSSIFLTTGVLLDKRAKYLLRICFQHGVVFLVFFASFLFLIRVNSACKIGNCDLTQRVDRTDRLFYFRSSYGKRIFVAIICSRHNTRAHHLSNFNRKRTLELFLIRFKYYCVLKSPTQHIEMSQFLLAI